MSENDIDARWEDLERRRNQLLSDSDWTQLPDVNLEEECVLKWRKWRSEVRKIDRTNFTDRLQANLYLRKLKDNMPEIVYGKSEKDDTVKRSDVYEIIKKFYKKIQELESKDKPDPIEEIKNAANTKDALRMANDLIDVMLEDKIADCSPKPHMSFMYLEKVNEAIDYLSGEGTTYPMLENLSSSLKMSMHEVAKSLLKTHGKAIGELVKVERAYFEAIQKLRTANNIDEILGVIEEFDGH